MARRRHPGMDGGPDRDRWQPKGDGKGGKDGPRRRNRGGGPLMKEARRDVLQSVKPVRREIRRARMQGTRDYERASEKASDLYGALSAQLAPLAGQFQSQAAGIGDALNDQLAGLGGMLGSTVPGVPEGEIGAGAGMFGALGGGALAELASTAQRNLGYQTSAQRQAAMEGTIAQRNYLADRTDFLDDLRQQRVDLMRDVPTLIRQRLDYLRDQKFDQGLALSELDLRRLMANRDYGLQSQALGMDRRQQDLMSQMYSDWLALERRRGQAQRALREGEGR